MGDALLVSWPRWSEFFSCWELILVALSSPSVCSYFNLWLIFQRIGNPSILRLSNGEGNLLRFELNSICSWFKGSTFPTYSIPLLERDQKSTVFSAGWFRLAWYFFLVVLPALFDQGSEQIYKTCWLDSKSQYGRLRCSSFESPFSTKEYRCQRPS